MNDLSAPTLSSCHSAKHDTYATLILSVLSA